MSWILALLLQADRDALLMKSPKDRTWFEVTPDGKTAICYVKERVFLSDGTTYDFDSVRHPAFGPVGRRFAIMGERKGRTLALVDGRPFEFAEQAHEIFFSPDEAHWAFVAFDPASGKAKVHRDGVKIDEYVADPKSGSRPVFAADGRLAYGVVRREDGLARAYVSLGGKLSPGYDAIDSIVFSRDGRRVAYEARRGEREFIVLDGQELTPYGLTCGFTFSPDGRRFAYMGAADGKTSVGDDIAVIDGRGAWRGHFADRFTFSPDSSRIAFVLDDEERWRHVIVDGKKGPRFENAYDLAFSPDSKRLAYSVQDGSDRRAVIDGKKGYLFRWTEPVLFTPDSRRAVYLARDEKKTHLVVDHEILRSYSEARALSVLPDGRRVALATLEGDELWWRVVPID